MDARDLGIGKLIEGDGPLPERDAIHVAVIAVTAGMKLEAKDPVMVVNGVATFGDRTDGIVDPFLPYMTEIQKGQRFWLFLKPGTVTSLRHEWVAPAFPVGERVPKTSAQDESKAWLQEEAEACGVALSTLLEMAEDGGVCSRGTAYGHDLGGKAAEFWLHVERYTGKHYDEAHRDKTYFSCSC